jgi:hypothetical protein
LISEVIMGVQGAKFVTTSTSARKAPAAGKKVSVCKAASASDVGSRRAEYRRINEMLDELKADGEALAARVHQLRQRFS